ncbi:uncharacterized protein [Littorina saxatilis]|uniref:uncharacterized protein n=1 Tax=Littorina saxatilis TaxID=31220 RepID=UPI0038B482E8
MPPVRTRAVPKRFADAPVNARGRPAKRGRQRGASTSTTAEGAAEAAPASTVLSDQRLAAGFEVVMALLQAMQQTNIQLAARMEAVEKAQAAPTAMDGSPAGVAQPGPSNSEQHQDTVVHNVLSTVLRRVTGEPGVTHVPVDLHIPDKLKHAIWQGQFVEFADLLHQDADPEYTLSVDTSGQPSLTLAQKSKQKKLSFTKWGEAWNLFQHVLTQQPSQTCAQTGFAKHYEVVSSLFHKGHDWDFYDRSFRTMLEKGLVQ